MNKGILAAFSVVLFTLATAASAQAPPAAPPPGCNACPPAAPPPDGNVALGKFAYQSSTYAGMDASRAVDGKWGTYISTGSVAVTNLEYNAWWAVDLGASYTIRQVDINFGVTYLFGIFGSARPIHFGIFAWDDAGYYWYLVKDVDIPTGLVAAPFRAVKTRYVMLQILSNYPDFLELGEVQILGH